MAWTPLLACIALAARPCASLNAIRSVSDRLQDAGSLSHRAYLETLADDQSFWDATWDATSKRLIELEQAAETSLGTISALQLSAAPGKNVTETKGHAKVSKRKADEASKLMASLHLNPKSPADLVPALAMLKAMYEQDKQSIKQLNAREKQSKERFAEQEARHNATLRRIEEKFGTNSTHFRNRSVAAEFRANETHDENRLWKYWEGVRQRQHRQFHTSLKIQHATMQKVKTMIDLYEKAIKGGEDKDAMRRDIAKVSGGAAPEVVLLQHEQVALLQHGWRDVARFCREALKEVRAARVEMQVSA